MLEDMSEGDERRPRESMTAGLTPMNTLSAPSAAPPRRARRPLVLAIAAVLVVAIVAVVAVAVSRQDSGPHGPYAETRAAYLDLRGEIDHVPAAVAGCRSIACFEGAFRQVTDRLQILADVLARTDYPPRARPAAARASARVHAVLRLAQRVAGASPSQVRDLVGGGNVFGRIRGAQVAVQRLLAVLRPGANSPVNR